ncbi:MAG TPA: uroporphyrinogen-III synthase, partial [Methylophilaceae bacterium]|nr:uroporphyrinogen-III synthase [Methylophilaceae bacterium]
QVILFPLIAISPLQDYTAFERQVVKLSHFDWAIFISTNAVQQGMPRLLNQLGQVPARLRFAAIGPTTAAELKKFGIDDTLVPDNRFDSESLLALPEMQNIHSQKVMIFRGEGGREVLADTLKSRGAHVEFAECYRRINPQTDIELLDVQRRMGKLDAIVVTSSEAMRHLLQFAGDAEWLASIPLCVNHERVADQPRQMGLRVAVAGASGDAAMLNCLTATLS